MSPTVNANPQCKTLRKTEVKKISFTHKWAWDITYILVGHWQYILLNTFQKYSDKSERVQKWIIK